METRNRVVEASGHALLERCSKRGNESSRDAMCYSPRVTYCRSEIATCDIVQHLAQVVAKTRHGLSFRLVVESSEKLRPQNAETPILELSQS